MIDRRCIARSLIGPRGRWLAWALVVLTAGAGLRFYHVDNALHHWTVGDGGPAAASVVVGAPTDQLNLGELVAACRGLAEVRSVLPIPATDARGSHVGLIALPEAGVEAGTLVSAVRAEARAAMRDRPDALAVAGPAAFGLALDNWSQRRLPMVMTGILLLGFMALWWMTRRLGTALTAATAIFSSQIVLLGIASWMGVAMNMVLAMVPPLMMALGFSYATHRAMRRDTGRALVLCGATTAAGMLTFSGTGFLPVRSFAFWGALGVGLVWLAVVLLVRPAAPGGCGAPKALRRPAFEAALVRMSRRHRVVILTLAALVLAGGVVAAPRLHLENDPLNYFPSHAPIVRQSRRLNSKLIGMLPSVVALPSAPGAASMLTSTAGVQRVAPLPATEPGSRRWLVLADNDALPALRRAAPAWRRWAYAHNGELAWSGVAAQLDEIQRSISRTALLALPTMIALAALVTGWVGGSWQWALIGACINALPVAMLIVFSGAAGRSLGLPSLMIGAIAVGVAVDDTMHLAYACRHRRRLPAALRRCAVPCAGSSLVTAACVSLFALCPFRPTAAFGLWMAIAVLAAAVADLVVLPATARWLGLKRSPAHGDMRDGRRRPGEVASAGGPLALGEQP